MAQRTVCQSLHHDAEQGRDRHGDEDCRHDGDPERNRVEAEVRPDHVDIAMGEVDELDDAVDHRVAESDQRVDAAERNPVDELLQNLLQYLHRKTSLR